MSDIPWELWIAFALMSYCLALLLQREHMEKVPRAAMFFVPAIGLSAIVVAFSLNPGGYLECKTLRWQIVAFVLIIELIAFLFTLAGTACLIAYAVPTKTWRKILIISVVSLLVSIVFAFVPCTQREVLKVRNRILKNRQSADGTQSAQVTNGCGSIENRWR